MAESEARPDTFTRVREISTRKLFGLYDHRVPLFLRDRVTIIHGANGVGKTVLLKLVNSLFSQDFWFLLSVPYEELLVALTDGTEIRVGTADQQLSLSAELAKSGSPQRSVRITVRKQDGREFSHEIRPEHFNFDEWARQFAARSAFFHGAGPDRFYDNTTEAFYTALELFRRVNSDPSERQVPPMNVEVPPELLKVLSSVGTQFIEAQRLVRFTAKSRAMRRAEVPSPTAAVQADAEELVSRLRDSFTQYGRTSQKLDQTFPQRLFRTPSSMSRDDIKSLLQEIEKDQFKLANLGVLDASQGPLSPSELDQSDDSKLDAMELFVKDNREKLRPLKDFAQRIEPLLANINSKFKNKQVRLDREKGLVARAVDGAEIRPDQLSSGEQHEIVLLFHLLFRSSKNSLVLIDEPELSLHIDWQRRFLPDLLEIAANAQIDALIATHSPFIAGSRDELMIDLDSVPD